MGRGLSVVIALAAATTPACAHVLSEDFNGTFPPAGWTVVDNLGNGDWQLNTFFGDDNWTGGDGTCADVNTDYYGSAHGMTVDTELISPAFVVPPDALLEFDTNYQTYTGNDYADTDISIDGGNNWINLLRWHGHGDQKGIFHGDGEFISVPIGYAGQTAQIRFHNYDANWEWYWQVDNVTVRPRCLGDLDGDGDVDLADLAQLLSNYGTTSGALYTDGDIDGDGDVDLSDLAELLAVYGTVCE